MNTAEAVSDLEAKACAMVPDIMSKRDEKMAEMRCLHEKDCTNYIFDCKRHGDFLLVTMTRGIKFATAINLGGSKTITIEQGRKPDLSGTVHFIIAYSDSGGSYVPAPLYPHSGYTGTVLVGPIPDHGMYGKIMHGSQTIRPNIPNYATPARDDRIYFSGIDVSIFAPAGLGQSVFDKIMTEFSLPGWR